MKKFVKFDSGERRVEFKKEENGPCTLLTEGGAMDGHHPGRGDFGEWVKNEHGGFTCTPVAG